MVAAVLCSFNLHYQYTFEIIVNVSKEWIHCTLYFCMHYSATVKC
jgi:hypothetical protein